MPIPNAEWRVHPPMSIAATPEEALITVDATECLYYGAYTTKHSMDCEKALSEAMLAIEKHENKVRK
jgi:hypothetical protein